MFFGNTDFYSVATDKKIGVNNVDCKALKLNKFILYRDLWD
jgi:hypothetical protein